MSRWLKGWSLPWSPTEPESMGLTTDDTASALEFTRARGRAVPFDPLREAAQLRIKVLDLPGGRKEFILPALRNLRMKLTFLVLWVEFAASFGFGVFVSGRQFTIDTNQPPACTLRVTNVLNAKCQMRNAE